MKLKVTSGSLTRLTATLALMLLAGCSTLPGVGPSKDDVLNPAADQQVLPYNVVEVDQPTIDTLGARTSASLFGSFGDNRPSPEQVIGTGDSVTVAIWEAASGGLFSSPSVDARGTGPRSVVIPEQIVGRDGSITVPYAGRIRVAGLRPPEVENAVVQRLVGKAIEPQALVTVSKTASSTVTVSGDVGNGAIVPISVRGQRVLDMIALAGGVRSPVHETFINLSRGGRTTQVPMQTIMRNPRENIFVRPDDVITVVREPQTFTAVGATARNAVVTFDAVGISLEEAIGKAGGLVNWQSDPSGVFVLRYEPLTLVQRLLPPQTAVQGAGSMVPVVYRLDMRKPGSLFLARRFSILNKDIVFVSNAPLNELQKIVSLLMTATTPIQTGIAVSNSMN